VCVCTSHLWKALFVHMVHHDYLIIITGGGASWAGGGQKNMEYSYKHFALKKASEPCIIVD